MSEQPALPGLDALIPDEEGISYARAQEISAAALEAFEARLLRGDEALRPLAESYLDARAKGWDWRKALYIAWARLPREARWPKSLGELASVMGLLSDRTIRKWRYQNPEIDRLVQEEMLARVGERTAEVLNALADLASRPDYKSTRAMELYLRVHGVYTPEQTVHTETSAPQIYLPETQAEPEAEPEAVADADLEA